MSRRLLRPYLAVFLLLCFMRTLLPEAWVLALHGHQHTTEEPAFAHAPGSQAGKQRVVFTSKHTHCHEETFYNVPFQAARPVQLPQPRVQLRYQQLAAPLVLASSAAALRRSALRGPPAAV